MSLQPADGSAQPGRTRVQLDYSKFREAFGADWASRLTFVQLPACALTEPDRPECRTATPVEAANDTKAAKLAADVEVTAPSGATSGTPAGSVARSESAAAFTAVQSGATVLAATAGAAGPEGDFKATSLAPSSSWSVSGNSGSFNWSYPLEVPPVPGGLAPKVALGYSSSSIDGRTSTTNNQSSWIGDGWDYDPGFIERSYTGCAGDKGQGSTAPSTSGDLCWKSDNATVSLNGNTSSLVRDDATGTWKLSNDDGSRVEKLNGNATDTANGDTDNEYWKVTTPDGTQYFFGKNRLPGWSAGKPETGSALTVPVFGNQPGEPGYAPAFQDSARDRAWRWQLDYVVDPHGNALAYFYDQEKNAYTKNIGATTGTPKANASYTRAATLNRIEYGHRAGQVYNASPAGKVAFSTADRCFAADCSFTKANAAVWYDTPADQACDIGQDCRNGAPTFWSKKRLTGIATQALQGNGTYRDIDSWSLFQDFPAVGDSGGRALWLQSISRTAKAGATQLALQPVTFGHGDPMPNRVDAAEGRPPMNRYRINRVGSETGSNTNIEYTKADCVAGALPAPDSNTRRCYPTWWTPDGAVDPVLDWFHKYLVDKVTEDDLVAGSGSADKVTKYDYIGDAAWRRDNSEFTPDKQRTWSDFRGYQRVQVRVGDSNKSLTETVYFRGMDGDTLANGQPRPVGQLQGITDSNELAGYARETIVYDQDGGRPLTSTVSTPWTRSTASRAVKALPTKDGTPTAVKPAESGRPEATALPPLTATMVRTKSESATSLNADGSAARSNRLTREFDDYGQATTVSDEGDTAVAGDEQCSRTTYVAADTANWLISYPQSVQTTSAVCSTGASPANVTSETRTYYDGKPLGAAPEPGKGNATKTEALERYDGANARYLTATTTVSDQYGRVTSVKDVNNAETTTAYTPASGSQPTTIQAVNPKKFTTTTTYDGLRALPVKAVDANDRTTYVDYDALGRTTAMWKPGRAKTSSANETYTYTIEAGRPPAVTTRTLLEGGDYRTSIALFDGLLRPRQVQEDAHGGTTAHNGGRNITDSFYDSHGRVYRSNAPYWNNTSPESSLWIGLDNKVPSQTDTEFDGLDRPTASIFKSQNVEKWRTTTRYGANWTAITPPEGGTPTLTVIDAHGRTTELRHYKSDGSPDYNAPASAYEALKYSYNLSGKLARAVDAAGNNWSWEYDLLGRQTKAVDPDKGTTTSTYNADGTLATVTDSRSKTLAYTYDELGRKTAMFDGSTTGTKLAAWTYDSLNGGKGLPVDSTRYDNGKAYTTAVAAYDAAGRPTSASVTIPTVTGEEALAATYTTSQSYTPDTGLVATTSYPAGGGLPEEILSRNYTPLGLPTSISNATRVYSLGNLYSPTGQVLQSVIGNIGSRTVQTYVYENATQRLAQVMSDREKAGPQTLDSKTYTYNPVGNITRIRNDRDDSSVTDTQCFTYDFAQRMTNAWTGTDDCVAKPGGGTQPKVGGIDPYWTSYTYDAAGNRTQETTRTSGALPGPLVDTSKVNAIAVAGDNQTSSVALADGKVWLAQQRPNGTWKNYEDLQSTTAGALPPVEHVAASWADNTLQIMAVAGGRVWHTLRNADGSWQKWGDVTPVAGSISNPNQLALSATASGLEVLTFSDGVLKHTLRRPNGAWSTWGNVFGEAGTLGTPTRVTSAATGAGLEVVVTAGGRLWHTIRNGGGNWQAWGDVFSVTGTLGSPGTVSATATNAGLEVVTLAGGSIWHTVRRPDASWQGWGNVSQAVGALTQPVSAAVVNSAGDLKLLVAAAGAVNYTKRSSATGSWLTWTQLAQTTENQQSEQTQRTSTYPTPGGFQPHALSRVDTTGPGARTDTFTYDNAGNTTRRVTADGDQTLEWDTEGHLAKSTTAGSSTTFLYDADGNRLLRREPDAVTLYLGGQELKLTKATNQVTGTRYITAGNVTIVKSSDGTLNYLLPDQQGTAQITVRSDNMAYTRADTTPFGTPRGKKPAAWPTERGFVGGIADSTTGLTHLGAREYDPANGRFISVDPVLNLTDPQQINGYTYSNNNPVNLSDQDGLWPKCSWCKKVAQTVGKFAAGVVDEAVGWVAENSPYTAGNNIIHGSYQAAGIPPPVPYMTPTATPMADTFGISQSDPAYIAGRVTEAVVEIAADGVGIVKGAVKGAKLVKTFVKDSGGVKKALKKVFGSCSFTPETPVLMADGTSKAIGDIQTGDKVKSGDPERPAGEDSGDRAVLATLVDDDEDLVDLTIKTAGAVEETVHTTSNHPFWDDTTRSWTPAGELIQGHALKSESGELVEVAAVRPVSGRASMHNLTVDDFHTYYVLAGTTSVLVHNSCDVPSSRGTGGGKPPAIEVDQAQPGWSQAERLAQLERRLPAFAVFSRSAATSSRTYVGALNTETGDFVLASSGGRVGCSSYCAEGNALLALGGDLSKIIFTDAYQVTKSVDGILTATPKPVCIYCQIDYPNRSSFVPGAVGAPGGSWGD
ncbi:polymorphic toxin-type HINT domain-containing protein [Kitasatospora sp. NPDC052868]|uniref:polymorphic toxin-type HINT domain-containing protein n=1 Tax=Kitasatospora sp. NPDC052868 TaxID=3364060 RepID=UPI0037CBBBCD